MIKPVDISEKPSRTAHTPINVPCKPCLRLMIAKLKNNAHVLSKMTRIKDIKKRASYILKTLTVK